MTIRAIGYTAISRWCGKFIAGIGYTMKSQRCDTFIAGSHISGLSPYYKVTLQSEPVWTSGLGNISATLKVEDLIYH